MLPNGAFMGWFGAQMAGQQSVEIIDGTIGCNEVQWEIVEIITAPVRLYGLWNRVDSLECGEDLGPEQSSKSVWGL